MSEDAEGYRAAEHPTGSERSDEPDAPRRKNAYKGTGLSEEPLRMTLNEDLLSDWLEDSVAYGAFENDKLIGMVEGFLEKWNNRFRIANICAFDQANRKSEIGTKLMETILKAAEKSGARMVVLETQTINFKAISFYKKTRI